jgi:CO dehydrogenase maturation factor
VAPDLTPREAAAIEILVREAAVVDELVAHAVDPLGWLAVQRQAGRYLRYLETWRAGPAGEAVKQRLAGHLEALRASSERAADEIGHLDAESLGEARSRLGIRVALIGKGGVGKTVIASTMARLLARRGRQVLAADLDTNPGLAVSLGLGLGDFALPAAVVEENAGSNYGWRLASSLTPTQAVEDFATVAPDGVRFLGLGKIDSADKGGAKQSVVALIQILLGFGAPGWDVIADLEAGPTTPFEGYHGFAEDVLVVVGPSWQSAMTARRLLPMVGDRRPSIVANRWHGEADHRGLVPRLRIPFDPEVAAAERRGDSPLDACPDSPVIDAIDQLIDLVLTTPQEVRT